MASRPTKYAHVVKGLPRYNGEDPARLDLLTAVRDEILGSSIDPEQDYNVSAQLLTATKRLDDQVAALLTYAKKCPGQGSAALARGYADARVVLDAINGWKSSAQLLVDAYERLMTDQMEAEGVASLRLASGASVSTYAEPYGTVVDKAAFRAWCVANGYEAQLQLWPSTMNAIAKERALAGEKAPDGVEVTAKTQVRLNKA